MHRGSCLWFLNQHYSLTGIIFSPLIWEYRLRNTLTRLVYWNVLISGRSPYWERAIPKGDAQPCIGSKLAAPPRAACVSRCIKERQDCPAPSSSATLTNHGGQKSRRHSCQVSSLVAPLWCARGVLCASVPSRGRVSRFRSGAGLAP